MILFYSGIRGDLCSPSVILGDRADVMLSFYECAKEDGSPAAGFTRLKKERMSDRKKPYRAFRHYRSDRDPETLYGVIDVAGEILEGPTAILTSLVMDCQPSILDAKLGKVMTLLIVRFNHDGTRTILYVADKNRWLPYRKPAKKGKRS